MRAIALVAAAALLTACGSTAQVSGTGALGTVGDPLGRPTAGAPSTGAPGGVAPVPGGSAQAPSGQAARSGEVAATTGLVGPAGPSAGSTRITTPIELGFMTTKVSNANQAGLNVGQTYSDQQAYDALVKEYNAHGGLAGRRIVPVYGETDTASTDWNTQFQAACQHLTTDHHVKAVLGYVFVFLDSFEQCLVGHGVAHLYGGYQPGDVQAQRDLPSIVSVGHPTVDGLNETVLTGAMASGLLTTSTKLGILYDGCAHGDRAFARSTVPWLKRHGIHYEAIYMECAGGSSDVGPAAAAVKSAELQFAAHGVTTVYIPNNIELLLFMQNAESQGYRPAYLTPGGGAALEANASIVPAEQMKNVHGFGWTPGIDVGQAHQPYAATPQQRACLTKLKNHGLVPKAFNDFMFAYVTCDALDLYARALALTGGSTTPRELQSALVRVMPSFQGAATYGGAFGVSAVQRGGPAQYREIGWTEGCGCFTYRGPVRRVPTA